MTTLIQEALSEWTVTDLVTSAQTGDREAFGELVVRYERAIYATAQRRLGDHGEAQELTQEVFVQAMERLYQLREPARFGGWLRSIANRMAINRATRRKAVAAADPTMLESACATSATPLDKVLEHERAAQVQAGLNRLRTMDRETLEAFYVEGHSLVEMSDNFDSPIGTIKRRLHVARKRLALELGEPSPL